MMGIKRGRKALGKKQINIRLLPEYSSLLENPNPIYWWIRKNGIRMGRIDKHGKAPGINPSNVVAKILDETMRSIIKEDPKAFLEHADSVFEVRPVHTKWLQIALREAE
jgi:hypothetical protein